MEKITFVESPNQRMWEKSITILKAKGKKEFKKLIEARKPRKNNKNKQKSFFFTSKSKSFMNSH